MNFLAQLVHVFIPQECVSCGNLFSLLCRSCAQKIRLFSPHCLYCQKTSGFGIIHEHCKQNSYCADFSFVLFHYTAVMKRIFNVFKYEEAYAYGDIVKELLASYSKADPFRLWQQLTSFKKIVIIPVPMHWSKLLQRGFSPAKMISQWISKLLGDKSVIEEKIIKKIRTTKKQAGLSKAERLKNQSKVFQVNEEKLVEVVKKYSPDLILIVDDVLSSGATTNSVVECLKQTMQKQKLNTIVGIFAVARG